MSCSSGVAIVVDKELVSHKQLGAIIAAVLEPTRYRTNFIVNIRRIRIEVGDTDQEILVSTSDSVPSHAHYVWSELRQTLEPIGT